MYITYTMSEPYMTVGILVVPKDMDSTVEILEWFLKTIANQHGPDRRMISFTFHYEL